jgi:hypothetical protein
MSPFASIRRAEDADDARRRYLAEVADVPEPERAAIAEILSESHVFPVYWCVALAVGRRDGAWAIDGPFAARSAAHARQLAAQAAASLDEARIVGPFPVMALRRLVGLG